MAPAKEEALPTHSVPASVMQMMAKVKVKPQLCKAKQGNSQGAGSSPPTGVVRTEQPAEEERSAKRARQSEGREAPLTQEADPGIVEFSIKLDMNGKPGLGIEVDWADGKTLLIKSIKAEGAIPQWNRDAGAGDAVQAGDRIVAINTKSGDPKAMLAECKNQKRLNLTVQRQPGSTGGQGFSESRKPLPPEPKLEALPAMPAVKPRRAPKHHEFTVTLDMSGHSLLGLDVDWADGRTLYIKDIQPGAVEDWNRQHPPHLVVHRGDRVVAVNGFADDPEAMAGLCRELCSTRSQVQLRVRVPPLPPPVPKDGPRDGAKDGPKEEKTESAAKEEDDRAAEKKEKKRKDKEKDKEKEKDKDRERDKDKEDRDRDKEREKEKDREKDREHERDRERDSDRGRDREKDRDKDRERDRERERERERDKDRDRGKEKDKDKEKEKDKDRERDKEGKDREKDRDNDRERDKAKTRRRSEER